MEFKKYCINYASVHMIEFDTCPIVWNTMNIPSVCNDKNMFYNLIDCFQCVNGDGANLFGDQHKSWNLA